MMNGNNWAGSSHSLVTLRRVGRPVPSGKSGQSENHLSRDTILRAAPGEKLMRGLSYTAKACHHRIVRWCNAERRRAMKTTLNPAGFVNCFNTAADGFGFLPSTGPAMFWLLVLSEVKDGRANTGG